MASLKGCNSPINTTLLDLFEYEYNISQKIILNQGHLFKALIHTSTR